LIDEAVGAGLRRNAKSKMTPEELEQILALRLRPEVAGLPTGKISA